MLVWVDTVKSLGLGYRKKKVPKPGLGWKTRNAMGVWARILWAVKFNTVPLISHREISN